MTTRKTTSSNGYTREADKYNAAGERLCVDCRYHLPLEKFYYETARSRYSSRCTKCNSLRSLYQINRRDFDEMMEAQGGACAICLTVLDSSKLVVDHSHSCCPGRISCGKCIRGLLCQGCNIGIGHFNDSVERMVFAVAYISRHDS